MKKICLTLVLLLTLITLTACDKAVPLEDPEPELFKPIYVQEDFVVLKRINPTQELFTMPAFSVGEENNTCIIGTPHRYHYIIKHDNEYYDLLEANKLGVYTCEDLDNAGVIDLVE